MFIRIKPPGQPGNPLARILGIVCAAAAFAVAMMFSVVIFAFLALAALVFWLWWQWKKRALRRVPRERTRGPSGGATIIEGEAVRVEERSRLE